MKTSPTRPHKISPQHYCLGIFDDYVGIDKKAAILISDLLRTSRTYERRRPYPSGFPEAENSDDRTEGRFRAGSTCVSATCTRPIAPSLSFLGFFKA